jgi:hypothetical protein
MGAGVVGAVVFVTGTTVVDVVGALGSAIVWGVLE